MMCSSHITAKSPTSSPDSTRHATLFCQDRHERKHKGRGSMPGLSFLIAVEFAYVEVEPPGLTVSPAGLLGLLLQSVVCPSKSPKSEASLQNPDCKP